MKWDTLDVMLQPAVVSHGTWGKTVGTKRPLTQKQIWAIRSSWIRKGEFEIVSFSISRSTASLAVADLVKIKTGDLVTGPEIRTRATVVQQKTGRPV